MALSNQEFIDWLDNPASIKCVLVITQANDGNGEVPIYLSNRNYISDNIGSADIAPNIPFLPILSNSVEFTESLPLNGTASISYGDLAINNTNGEYDAWIDYVWLNRPIEIFIGDISAPVEDFTKIFSGLMADIAFSDRNTINLHVRDILQRLNTPITESVLGNYGTQGASNVNKEAIKPLVFGEVHNITPLLIDSATLEYMVHNGTIESLIEVRDNGVPVPFVQGAGNAGTFTLLYPPAGTVTCSVQGDNKTVDEFGDTQISTYTNTVTKLIQRIITGFGKSAEAIVASEMNLTNLNAFNTAHQQAVGVYISDRSNVLSVCQELAASIGAQFVATRLGKIELLKLTSPTTGIFDIDDNVILQKSLSISNKPEVVGSVKLGYCKNWTVQSGMVTGIPEEHKDMFALDYYIHTVTDGAINTTYKLSAMPEQINTLLLTNVGNIVGIEATRRLNIFNKIRLVYTMECTPTAMTLKLGDMINLTHSRYGLSGTKFGQIVSITTNWDTGIVKLEVFV